MTICASLFTHLLEDDCRHYLAEISRVSKPRGLALISIHNEPPHGERFAGDESRIDIEEAYFVELAALYSNGEPDPERVDALSKKYAIRYL